MIFCIAFFSHEILFELFRILPFTQNPIWHFYVILILTKGLSPKNLSIFIVIVFLQLLCLSLFLFCFFFYYNNFGFLIFYLNYYSTNFLLELILKNHVGSQGLVWGAKNIYSDWGGTQGSIFNQKVERNRYKKSDEKFDPKSMIQFYP